MFLQPTIGLHLTQAQGKNPYKLYMNWTVRTKLPTLPQVNLDAEAMQKDQEAKVRMKAYADL